MSGALDVPVLILGGGPVGMSTALGLRHLGVECMLVERHASTLDFPKGRRVTTRTVEILRQWGLEGAVSEVSLTPGESLFVFEGETLLGPDFRRQGFPYDPTSPSSPVRELMCSQERLEPVLRRRAGDAGADLRFATELSSFTQDESVVTAELTADDGPFSVRASYLVAADGVRGVTRDVLGISRSGPGGRGHRVSLLVESDIEALMTERRSAVYWLRQPREGSLFAAVDNKRRWLCVLPYDPVTEPQESFTRDRCIDLVHGALGTTQVEIRYIGHRFWEPTALVADRYQSGRVFLAGDAAHVTTPEGGLGMNCGVADAHNLAWKLAGVLAGWGGPALLTSYEPERRPHAVACVHASLGPARPPNPIDGLVLGQVYRSSVITDDGTDAPTSLDPVGQYQPTGRPGHRAPHLWLEQDRSTLDLFGTAFVALTDPTGEQALQSATEGARASGVPIDVQVIQAPGWHELFGVDLGGTVLVRPDGYVAWRSVRAPLPAQEFLAGLRVAAGLGENLTGVAA
jgi:2-polyprenyl-6-methoxyphenol hydroxylase-like FAD-dependent oxidoreductase